MSRTARYLLALVSLAAIVGCTPSASDEPKTHVVPLSKSPSAFAEESTQPGRNQSRSLPDRSTGDEPKTPGKTPEISSSTRRQTQPVQTIDELLLFFPSKHPHGNWQPKGLKFHDVWFTADDDVRIHGWYCPCKNARAVLLYAHGNAGNLSHRSALLSRLQNQLHVVVLIFDYRGYGRSAGLPTVHGILKDARAARKFLARHAGVKESEIVLMGRSLGGAVVTQLAAEARPRGLILESTFSSLKDVASHHYPLLAWLVPPKKLDSATQISSYKGPLLQSHGDADRTIPYASGMKLFRAANEPKSFFTISGGDHNDPQSGRYYERLDHFIDSLPSR